MKLAALTAESSDASSGVGNGEGGGGGDSVPLTVQGGGGHEQCKRTRREAELGSDDSLDLQDGLGADTDQEDSKGGKSDGRIRHSGSAEGIFGLILFLSAVLC